MKDLLLYILHSIVDKKEEVEISESETETHSITFTVRVAPEDMGKVIGKSGKMIHAIRDCLKIRALKENKHVNVILAE